MAKNDTVALFHPGGSKVEIDADNKTRIDLLKSRGFTTSKPGTSPAFPAPSK